MSAFNLDLPTTDFGLLDLLSFRPGPERLAMTIISADGTRHVMSRKEILARPVTGSPVVNQPARTKPSEEPGDPGPWYWLLTDKAAVKPGLFRAISRGLTLAARELDIPAPRFVVFSGPLDQKPPPGLALKFEVGRVLGATFEVEKGFFMVGVVSHVSARQGFITASHECFHVSQRLRGLPADSVGAEDAARRFEARFARRYPEGYELQ